ncbi:uncharacterized protein LOC117103008 [Anneissia japonica]|uniref:uncharacterized protein LOC117103008 n=1 Tax=Anneissia japonica TaxID=1529436 RepID=UPI001425721C|nr:uncharacterized protein LOC117103008 [Anneissia japonica]
MTACQLQYMQGIKAGKGYIKEYNKGEVLVDSSVVVADEANFDEAVADEVVADEEVAGEVDVSVVADANSDGNVSYSAGDTSSGEQSPVESSKQNSVDNFTKYLIKKELLSNGLIKFADCPMNYRSWKASFTGVINELELVPREELDLLTRWLGNESQGHAKRIRAVHVPNTKAGLKALWERLDELYGASEILEKSLMNRIESFHNLSITENARLRDLGDLLKQIQGARDDGTLPGLDYLDTSKGISNIVNKLPYLLQKKWRTKGALYKQEKGVPFPPFSIFVEFVSQQAKIRNDPSFASSQAQANTRKPAARSFNTSAKVEKKHGCQACGENHSICTCKLFKEMSTEEKQALVRTKRLCNGCLKRGHIWKECRKKSICEICQGKHPTVLHIHRRNPTSTSNAPQTVSSFRAESRDDAMLQILLINNPSVEEDTVSCERIDGLIITGWQEEKIIELPCSYTRTNIPVTQSQIPTSESTNGWAHLQSVKKFLMPYNGDIEVGLLIGANCARALKPREVVPGQDDYPYAIKTSLGWGIVGLIGGRKECKLGHVVYRTTTNEILSMFEADFVEREAEPMSVNDRKFIEVMDKRVYSLQGSSLNDYLLQGPNLTNSLLGVLLKFRVEPIAIVGDIEGMFNQVLVRPCDRDF